jgi:hypothetical protein
MINIDTRLIDLMPLIGSDAFCVLVVLGKYANTNKECFPSIELLKEKTGLGRTALYKSLNVLKEHKIIEATQRRHEKGRFTSCLYKITTEYLAIFVKAPSEPAEELKTVSPSTDVRKPTHGVRYVGKQHTKLLINNLEVIKQSPEIINQPPEQRAREENNFEEVNTASSKPIDPFDLPSLSREFLAEYNYQGGPVFEPETRRLLQEAFAQGWLTREKLFHAVSVYNAWIIATNRTYKHSPKTWLDKGLYNKLDEFKVQTSKPEMLDPAAEKKKLREQIDKEYAVEFGPPTGLMGNYEGEAFEHYCVWTKRRTHELQGKSPKPMMATQVTPMISQLAERMTIKNG